MTSIYHFHKFSPPQRYVSIHPLNNPQLWEDFTLSRVSDCFVCTSQILPIISVQFSPRKPSVGVQQLFVFFQRQSCPRKEIYSANFFGHGRFPAAKIRGSLSQSFPLPVPVYLRAKTKGILCSMVTTLYHFTASLILFMFSLFRSALRGCRREHVCFVGGSGSFRIGKSHIFFPRVQRGWSFAPHARVGWTDLLGSWEGAFVGFPASTLWATWVDMLAE